MITIFGSINVDLVATAERLPRPGETVAGTGFFTAAGGKGANQALAATRAGRRVRMAGAVGTDDFAEPALRLLRAAGTDLSQVRQATGPTGTALILVDAGGENMITVVPGANGALTQDDADAALAGLGVGDILLLQLEIPAEAVERALREARRRGIRTLLNIAPLIDDAPRLGRMADIVIANETEFERLVGAEVRSAVEREQALTVLNAETGQVIIVTLGAEGAIAINSAGRLHRVSCPRIVPVDAVGAGDTFCGYLAAGLDTGLDLAEALGRAAVAGSIACLRPGAQPAIPRAAEVAAMGGGPVSVTS